MPVYEFEVSAKIIIRMEGDTPEKASSNLEGLLEDFYIEIPCGGHEIKFGDYPATVWADDMKPTLKRELPEGIDPTKSTRLSMKEYIKMCMGDEEEEENTDVTFCHSELVELRRTLDKEVAELPHLKENGWQPEKVDYDAVKPKTLDKIAYKIWEKSDKSKDVQCYLSEAEEIWQIIRYGIY